MKVKSMGGKVAMSLLGTALVVSALAVGPVALHAQDQPQPRTFDLQRGPDDGGGWAGIGIEDVASAKAKELKLPGEYGALVTEVGNDSPAAKAGIKQGDVITEYNGQRVEGAAALRRLVRETPPGHTAKVALWRDGKAQTISLEVAGRPAGPGAGMGRRNFENRQMPPRADGGPGMPVPRGDFPGPFGFRGMPTMPFGGNGMGDRRAMMSPPALGVSAQDLSGQLGNYFGAPDGEGVLVTDVPMNSPGGKGGLKTGDVITQVDGELRNRLRDKQREGQSVKLDVLRKGAAVSVSVQLEKPPAPPNRPGAGERSIPL